MKALQDFVIITNEGGTRITYKEGAPKKGLIFTQIKKGKEVPRRFLKDLVEKNLNLLDIIYVEKRPTNIPKDLGVVLPEPPKEMKIKKRKYSQDSLNIIFNEKGFSELKKIGQTFGVTDRSSRRLIVEILKAQEEQQV